MVKSSLVAALTGSEWMGWLARQLNDESVRAVARPEVLVLFLLLWLLLRRRNAGPDLHGRSDRILRERFERGEITAQTYDRLRDQRVRSG